MITVTLPKSKYQVLKKRAEAYELILNIIEDDLFSPPLTWNRRKIVNEFKKTGLYSQKFIDNPEKSLQRSSYFEN